MSVTRGTNAATLVMDISHALFLLGIFILMHVSHGSFAVLGQGVNIKVPLPVVDNILGSNSDKDHEDRWWFWVIIGIIGAFFIVGVYFTIRGFLRYRKLQGQQEDVDEADWQHHGQMGRKFSTEYFQSIQETRGGMNTINSDVIQNRDMLIQRCGILSPGNARGAMMPASSSSEHASILREHVVMQKVNPRMVMI